MTLIQIANMNERIKLLAEQAGYTKDMFGVGHWDMPECKKFAELIVGDCASVCENSNYEFGTIFTKMIKQHFGVK